MAMTNRSGPLPNGETVVRFATTGLVDPDTRWVSPQAFSLSTEDRGNEQPRLSVWARSLTTVQQALAIMDPSPPDKYAYALDLEVDSIRLIPLGREESGGAALNVEWDVHPQVGVMSGAEGHAGVTGLWSGSSSNRKRLRQALADMTVYNRVGCATATPEG